MLMMIYMRSKSTIALLGGNGQIAKSIIPKLQKSFFVDVYSRKKVINDNSIKNNSSVKNYSYKSFPFNKDIVAVINCAGPSDPKIHQINRNIFKIFNDIDNNILDFIKNNKTVKYINISTGTVVNLKFLKKDKKEKNQYLKVKLFIENKHRKLKKLKIYDLRILGFFSNHIPLNYSFFLSQVFKSIAKRKELIVDSFDNIRDYVGGDDIAKFITSLINKNFSNRSFNLLSKKKVSKFTLLNYLSNRFNLKYSIDMSIVNDKKQSVRLIIKNYKKSKYFTPTYSSLGLIKKESQKVA